MGRGFVFCAIVCSALALALYAGLFEFLGVSASVTVFLLLGICLLFHGAALYMVKPRGKSDDHLESGAAEEHVSDSEPPSNGKKNRSAASPLRGSDVVGTPERSVQARGSGD